MLLFPTKQKITLIPVTFLVGRGGFEPPKTESTDLQSVAFGRSAIFPNGAGGRNRTNNLLITSQLLYR